jgi:hypothetical protein
MRAAQLRLVQDDLPTARLSTDPARRIFDRWLFMLGRSPRRCKLGPTRRAAINAALAMGYDEETLLLTVDGIASDPLEGKPDSMRAAMRELEWLLRSEARIEHWAGLGDALHARLETPDSEAEAPTVVDEEAERVHQEAARQLAHALRGGRHG